ncbi:MFS transporter [Paenibacillus sp. VT-400]|uniref:MFS transporter n=1 Tax=Paenibacillus sp. VT-400 TaxID=1495853 RepID=UPI0006497261|nr:MFS transporter [Paenibacillus sp. VT-400]KLU54984.1 MFS transporter [Paenibacillus sp. VT-400]
MEVLQKGKNWTSIVFLITTFCLGMTEFVVTGLLTQFSVDLNVDISVTGMLLGMYALGVAVLGPLLHMMTIRVSPKKLLVGYMVVFILSNAAAAAAPNFEVLLVSRMLSAAIHAPYFGVAMLVAVRLAKPGQAPRAMSLVNAGVTIALLIGVPFGSYLGGVFEWRYVFWFVVVLSSLSLLGLIFAIPDQKPEKAPDLRSELRMFKNRHVLLIMAVVLLGYSGVFAAYTFTEPMLREISGFSVLGVTTGLFLWGLGAVCGNYLSGKIKQHNLTFWLIAALIMLAFVMSLFTQLLVFPIVAFSLCFLLGFGTFGTIPILNSKIVLAAREAPSMSGTIAASTVNMANFLGATLGTFLVNSGVSFTGLTWFSTGIVLLGILISSLMFQLEKRSYFTTSA